VPRASGARSSTVIAPKRKAELAASRTASTPARLTTAYDRAVSGPDARVTEFAELLVDYSTGVQEGWQVLVVTTSEAEPLARELSRLIGERGAYALQRISLGGLYPFDSDWLAAAPAELALAPAPLDRELLDGVDASIFVTAPPARAGDASPELRRRLTAQLLAWRGRGRRDEIPSVATMLPCPYFAARTDLTLAGYEDVFYRACLRDWRAERAAMLPVLERFDAAREVRIVADGTDLTLSLAGRTGAIDDGHANLPSGEVYYSPVEDSAEGVVSFPVPAYTASGVVSGVRLRLEAGEVVEAIAEEGEELLRHALETDDGARRLGELGLGCNDAIPRPMHHVLFDEKLAGTVHLALGDGFEHLGGRNRSALHWDLVVDLRRGGELRADGELVQQDGRWL